MFELVKQSQQVTTKSFGGRLLGNKPVTGGMLATGRRTSSLFYWAHSVAADDCEFGLHGHQGFEILTFVLKGENAHFDTTSKRWTPLRAGDFQVIRSGSGLEHSERLSKGAEGFQLWFDPNWHAALALAPTYADYRARDFQPERRGSADVIEYVGGTSSARVLTEGLNVRKLSFHSGGHTPLVLAAHALNVIYSLAGKPRLNGVATSANDVIYSTDAQIDIAHEAGDEVFVVGVPAAPRYQPLVGTA